ncbi:MAG: SAM-dependent chlorinase/fluorinase, partial [Candidatus Brockarchaeota archaeon]|nr:SAM-dependent chlorinase/fluorinase [Candidatus Brockarchaeota archaeon]
MPVPARIVTLLTDFGTRDHYVASMKGVLLGIEPRLQVIDVSHDVPKFGVRRAAITLAQAAKFFPRGTVHVAVVDPGVGTPRKHLILETKRFFFVGPDNGVLSIAAEEDGIKGAYEIRGSRYVFQERSNTFAGRDVFAPAAAHLAKGLPPERLGEEIDPSEIKKVGIGEPRKSGRRVEGEILAIDEFGNLVTNITRSLVGELKFGKAITGKVGGSSLKVPFL